MCPRLKEVQEDGPGAAPGNAGGGGGQAETSSAHTVDGGALTDFILRSDASPGECGYVIGKVTDLARELEAERRECARLREELARAKEAEAEALVQAGEAAERAWEYSLKLDILTPRAVRKLLGKNENTIQRLRAERKQWAFIAGNWRRVALRYIHSGPLP